MPSKSPEVWRRAAARYRDKHPEKVSSYNRAYYQANPMRAKRRAGNSHFRRRYGLSLAERDAMLAAQGGRCKACGSGDPGSKRGWEVDHDHTNGHVRGVLCHPCNSTLGHAHDDPLRLRALADFVEACRG